jgi:hypothetical protein
MGSSFKERKPPSDEEIRAYFQILQEDPRSRVFAPLAESLIRRGRLEEAESLCRLGLEHNPDFSDGHLALARALFYRFRHDDALREIKLALALDRANCEAYLIAADIFLARSQAKAAVEALMKVLDLEPAHPEAQRLLARLTSEARPGSRPALPGAPDLAAFRAVAPTSASQRQGGGGRPPTNPFSMLMASLEDEADQALERADPPFTALSSGSQAERPRDPAQRPSAVADDLEGEPTQRQDRNPLLGPSPAPAGRPRPARPQTPALPPLPSESAPSSPPRARKPTAPRAAERPAAPLPPRPATPSPDPLQAERLDPLALFDQIPEHTPIPSQMPVELRPSGRAARATSAPAVPLGLARVDAIQAVIDQVAPPAEARPDGVEIPLRVPRSGRWWVLLALLALVATLAGLVYATTFESRQEPAVHSLPSEPPTVPDQPAEPPPVEAPPIEALPVEAPPVEAPPVETPPVETPQPSLEEEPPLAAPPGPAARPPKSPPRKPVKKKPPRTRPRPAGQPRGGR